MSSPPGYVHYLRDEHAKALAKDPECKDIPGVRLFEGAKAEALKMKQECEIRPHEQQGKDKAQKIVSQVASELALDKPSEVIIRDLQEGFNIYTDYDQSVFSSCTTFFKHVGEMKNQITLP